jgi:hypothetical protein
VADLGIGTAHDGPTPTTESLSDALRITLTPETRTRATAVAGTIRTDGATVAARLLLDRSAEKGRQRPREPRRIVEPGKVPGAGLHRQLGMLEETRHTRRRSAAAVRRRTHLRATAPGSKIILLGVRKRHGETAHHWPNRGEWQSTRCGLHTYTPTASRTYRSASARCSRFAPQTSLNGSRIFVSTCPQWRGAKLSARRARIRDEQSPCFSTRPPPGPSPRDSGGRYARLGPAPQTRGRPKSVLRTELGRQWSHKPLFDGQSADAGTFTSA